MSGRTYYPLRRGIAVTSRDLRIGPKVFAIQDLDGVGWRRGPQRSSWQLWAYHQREQVLLWISRDETEFWQVCRALQRAIEARQELTPS